MFKPIMSFVRVMKGPVAKAGSMFILFNNNGKAVPKIDANKITINKDKVTAIGMACESSWKNCVRINMMEEQMEAFRRAPPISFRMF